MAGQCGMVDDGCGTMQQCNDCDAGMAGETGPCQLMPPYPNLVTATSPCVLANCCPQENAWAQGCGGGACGSNGCSGAGAAYCTCLTGTCGGNP